MAAIICGRAASHTAKRPIVPMGLYARSRYDAPTVRLPPSRCASSGQGSRTPRTSHMVNRATVQEAIDAGAGVIRLEPSWVPRTFMLPGRRLKLHPDDLYAL